MKKITYTLMTAFAIAIFSLATTNVNAQAPAPHVFHVNTQYSISGLDSTARAERNVILKEYHDKVTMKNDLVLHVWTLGHFFTEDSREFVTIYEFASWEDITKAFDKDSELEMKAWPDTKQRADFMKKMNSYFTSHKDAIFNSIPGLSK